MRGYSIFIIIQDLMYHTFTETFGRPPRREEIPKPCDYFDLIGGTGTGGLIAIMLGRLRLDLETCMDVYVRMTKKVFESDKTFAGVPYKHTLFKASKLEEAIKQCVKEHTIHEDEGNDGRVGTMGVKEAAELRRSISMKSTNSTYNVASPASYENRNSMGSLGYGQTMWGDPNASLYDGRENRTKTAITAVYKDTDPKKGSSILMRSYDSRKEPPPEFNCTIWQAGRATCATGLAFKPIHIGQSVFVDEGAGKYNPSPQILEEAVANEWPGRELGVFVSIGTGKRPGGTNNSQSEWWEGFVGGSVGSFAEARRRLISKIEACEDTHIQMVNHDLPKRGVPLENYFRLNVEVGVGEFGMNEWDRLSDMTISTRKYLGRPETQKAIELAAYKIAKIELMKRRVEGTGVQRRVASDSNKDLPTVPEQTMGQGQQQWPAPAELPADVPDPYSSRIPQDYRIPGYPPYSDGTATTSTSDRHLTVSSATTQSPRVSVELPATGSVEQFKMYGNNNNSDYQTHHQPVSPPPIPPKTPINDTAHPSRFSQSTISPISPQSAGPYTIGGGFVRPPYPVDVAGPPPAINRTKKPEFVPR